MAKFFTPAIRLANSGSALTLRSVQTVEQTVQQTSVHATQPSDFSGVIRARYAVHRDNGGGGGDGGGGGGLLYTSRDFRRYLTPMAVAPPGTPNNGGLGPNTPSTLDYVGSSPPSLFGSIARSTDGISWSISETPSQVYSDIASDGAGTFVAVGEGIDTSTDGINWTRRFVFPSVGNTFVDCVAWAGTFFVAGGVGGDGDTGLVFTSPDGIAWTQRTVPAGAQAYTGAAWNGTHIVVVGNAIFPLFFITSTDGIAWVSATTVGLAAGPTSHVVAGGPQFLALALGGNNDYATSPLGTMWTEQGAGPADPSDNYINGVWNGSKYVIVGVSTVGGGSATSTDGLSWTPHPTPAGNQYLSVAWNGSKFVAVGGLTAPPFTSKAITSSDGVTWFEQIIPGANEYIGVAWNGSIFAAVLGPP